MEAFKNIHKNQDIYLIGSGKSLDFIDPCFFDNKITIGVNQVFKKISCRYNVRKELKYLAETMSLLKEDTISFVSEGDCGRLGKKNRKYIENNHPEDKRIVLFKHQENKLVLKELPNENEIVVSWSTITSAIHIAAYMGAKNIILVGHDCGTLDNESNFSGYHTEETLKIAHKNVGGYKKWIPKIEEQTITLKKLLKEKYDCNVYSFNPFINFGLEGHIYRGTYQSKSG